MLSFFKKNTPVNLKVDVHSHLLPGLDDGSPSVENSIELLQAFESLGYEKVITTPHVIPDQYDNTSEEILSVLESLRKEMRTAGLTIKIEAAAEYYLDEYLIERLDKKEELLTFGNQYLLFETPYVNEPVFIGEAIFKMQSAGYQPVLAHPERYLYLIGKDEKVMQWVEKGLKLQVNLNSLKGYYSKSSKKLAESFIKKGIVSFLGSDCHHIKQLEVLKEVKESRLYAKAFDKCEILNNHL
ncbi:MAG: capsular biosynthesis protein [Cyclobacteriaceae bacterium]|nr:capsular biosynthesis protein [Cyclobacteriaceae bacterium]MCH8515086.1 capsular biosynthesis protein [Cyclobacteriaceae bacterium]